MRRPSLMGRVEAEIVWTGSRARAEALLAAVAPDDPESFDAEIVDVARDSVIVEITASPYTIDRFLEVAGDFGVLELTRTGVVSMTRGGNGKT